MQRRRSAGAIATTLAIALAVAPLLLAAPVPATAQGAVPVGCPAPVPTDEVVVGLRGSGLTVSRGTSLETFDAIVVGVLQDAVAPGHPLVLVEVDSPELRRVGGVWSGMSGSPIHVGGRLLGAVSYGFAAGPSRLAGVTPAASLYEVATRGGPAAIGPPRVPRPARAAAAGGHHRDSRPRRPAR